ncbi:hypothetical protein TNCV_1433201 [Trichonephila clavipes]|nr:hypothetical protein TNCV_1433201 [Trichonephila clavipes]
MALSDSLPQINLGVQDPLEAHVTNFAAYINLHYLVRACNIVFHQSPGKHYQKRKQMFAGTLEDKENHIYSTLRRPDDTSREYYYQGSISAGKGRGLRIRMEMEI